MRPRYHYAAAANWLSDPNGLVFHEGEWHMAYQYNPFGEEWGHMSWGHAVSADLAHWTELRVALAEEADGTMMFSGSAVVDRGNTGGFGKDALVAIYTGAQGTPSHQFQCLASSTDKGRHWTKFAGNPVLDRGMADFRDPNVFWHEGTGRWIMSVVLSTENRALLYASSDLKAWQELSEIPTDGAPGHVWECPFLVELPVERTAETRWLFKVDVFSGAPGSGALYRVGAFDGTTFTPETAWLLADEGNDFYAAIGWQEPRDAAGRPAWIAWMGNHAHQKYLPLQGWRGAMSVPRRMSLRREGQGYRLVQTVEPACRALFGAEAVMPLSSAGAAIPAASLLQLSGSAPWRLRLSDAHGRVFEIQRLPGTLRVDRRDPVTPQLDLTRTCAMASDAALELWLDSGSLEIFGDNGAFTLTLQHRLAGKEWTLRGEGGAAALYTAV